MKRFLTIAALGFAACAERTDEAPEGMPLANEPLTSAPGSDPAAVPSPAGSDPAAVPSPEMPRPLGGQTGEEGNDGVDAAGLPPEFERTENGDVVVPEAYKQCAVDADCILVETSCAYCCGRDAIRADLQDEYAAAFSLSCEWYSGGVCDCKPPAVEARCIEQRCTAAEAP